MNEYLKLYRKLENDVHKSFSNRNKLVSKYAWAIPNEEALQVLVDYSPIIEIGAGTGYWAYLAKNMGANIICYDNFLGDENHYKHFVTWVDVYKGNEKILKKHKNEHRTLFLCWPPYGDKMAFNCVKFFEGDTIIYIGEGVDGCNGDENYHNHLFNYWKVEKTVGIPQWWGLHDLLTVYKRI